MKNPKFNIPKSPEMTVANGLFYGSIIFGSIFVATTIFGERENSIKGLDYILQGKEFMMEDINKDGKLDMISKKGIYLQTKNGKFEECKDLRKYLK